VGFGVVLQGRVDFAIGGRTQHVDAGPGPAARHNEDCFAINLLKPTRLERRLHKGAFVRKVNINVAHAWLEAHLADHAEDRKVLQFLNRHLAVPRWRAPAALRRPAEQILAPPRYHGALQTLYTESRALEIIAASLQAINRLKHGESAPDVPPNTRHNPSHTSRLREYVETRLLATDIGQTPQNLDAIAGQLGMSVSTLQRLCKSLYGKTLFDYVRQRRLEMARDAIQHRRASIGEAAFIAGYRHSSNFTSAFKRAFGISPGALQSRRAPPTA
jgi:AraC-like DNA-binding protein